MSWCQDINFPCDGVTVAASPGSAGAFRLIQRNSSFLTPTWTQKRWAEVCVCINIWSISCKWRLLLLLFFFSFFQVGFYARYKSNRLETRVAVFNFCRFGIIKLFMFKLDRQESESVVILWFNAAFCWINALSMCGSPDVTADPPHPNQTGTRTWTRTPASGIYSWFL